MHLKDVVFLVIFPRLFEGMFFFWRICVFQNLHGSSFSEFTNCLGSGFGLRKERSHLTVDLLRNFSVLFSADLPTCHIISRTSKSCPFSLRTNLLWNCSPKNSWRGRDEGRKCLQNPSFDENTPIGF